MGRKQLDKSRRDEYKVSRQLAKPHYENHAMVVLSDKIQQLIPDTVFKGVNKSGMGKITFTLGIDPLYDIKASLRVVASFNLEDKTVNLCIYTTDNTVVSKCDNFTYSAKTLVAPILALFIGVLNTLINSSTIKTSEGHKDLYPLMKDSLEQFYGSLCYSLGAFTSS